MFMKTSTKTRSYYPKDSKYYINLNNLAYNKMKDDTCSMPINGFVRLKSKMYIFFTEENHESKKAKDIGKNIVDDKLRYEDYKNVLFNRSYMRYEMNRIQSKDHNIVSYRINEVSLLFYYDRKYVLKDGYSKLSHLHKSTR